MTNSNNLQSWLARPNFRAKLDRELATRSFREFVRQAWAIIEPHTPFVPGWHIDAIIEHLEAVTRGEIRNLLINVPPRHMKSLLVSVFWPAWEWIQHPERRWLFSSYAATLSIRDSVKCRHADRVALVSELLGRPVCSGERPEHENADSTTTAPAIASPPRWAERQPAKAATASSATIRTTFKRPNRIRFARATLDWFDVVMSTRVNDPRTAAKVVVMQRCHQQDLSGHLLEQGGWEHLCLPAEYEGPGARDVDRLLRSAHAAGRTAVGRTVRSQGNRGSETQSRQLRRGRAASAAAVARRWRDDQTPLVPILATAGRQPSAGFGAVPGWQRAVDRCSRNREGRRAGAVLGLLVQGSGDVGLCGRPGLGAMGLLFPAAGSGARPHGLPRHSEGRQGDVEEVA